jgi:hypothetical protein
VNCADHGDCLVGQGGSPDTCDTCAAGSITNTLEQSGGTTCTACGPGQATAASTVACADCIAGEYSTAGMASCTACNGGSITDTLDQPAGTTCTACDAGRYSTASTVACTACAAGSATDTLGQSGGTTCMECFFGRYSAASTVACALCAAGSITDTLDQPAGTTCTECDAGQASFTSTVACADCIAGEYSTAGLASCIACGAGNFTDTLDQPAGTTCTGCEPGQYGTISTVLCADCGAGFETNTLADPGAESCVACAGGQFSDFSTEECAPCSPGRYVPIGGSACLDCLLGLYQELEGMSECEPCGDPVKWINPADESLGVVECDLADPDCNLFGGFETRTVLDSGGLSNYTTARAASCAVCAMGKYSQWPYFNSTATDVDDIEDLIDTRYSGESLCVNHPDAVQPDGVLGCSAGTQ